MSDVIQAKINRVCRELQRRGLQVPVYEWSYKWDPKIRYVGPMADEVQAVAPDLVAQIDGLLCLLEPKPKWVRL